jgi:hypothetical protein
MYFPEESFFFEFEVMVTPRQFLWGGEKREKTDEDSLILVHPPPAWHSTDPSTQPTQHIKRIVLSWRNIRTHTTSLT